MNQLQQLPATQKSEIEFVPYGAQDAIKLSVNIIKNYVAIPTKSGKLPDDRECVRFLMLCKSRRLNPFEGDCFLQGYDGRDGAQFSLITAHQAFLKRAEHHPEYDGMRSGVIVRNENGDVTDREGDFTFDEDSLLGAWATIYFKQRKQVMHRRLKLATFRKPFGRWNDDAAGMIVKCAEADALRSSFPTLLGGLYSAEEIGRIEPATSTVRLADLSDLGPQKPPIAVQTPKGPVPIKEGDVWTDHATGVVHVFKAGAWTPSGSPVAPLVVVPIAPVSESAPAPATEPGQATGEAVCKYCGQSVADIGSHNCPEMQKTVAAREAQGRAEQPPMEALSALMERDGVSLDQVMAFTFANKLRKGNQKLTDLSGQKLQNLVNSWATLLPELQKLSQPA